MMKPLVLAAVLTMLGCSSLAQQARDSDEVARVGDRTITLKEVEDRWKKDDAAEHAEVAQKLYEGRRSALDDIVAEILITEASRGTGLSREAYEEAEISKRAKKVTPADVESFYKTNINEMGGRTFDTAAPLINRFLEDQYRTAARQELITELKKKGTPVRVTLEAPRYTVPVEATDPSTGSASAPVTVVEFSDFQCPYCQRASPTLKQLQKAYGDKVRIVWKDFPLTRIHPEAFKAAEAAHCAGDQGKFWEYHDRLFSNQQALKTDSLLKHALDTGLDVGRFGECLAKSKYAERVRDGLALGERLGVNSTPTLYINGRALAGAYPIETLSEVVNEELERLKK
jgi:protein-disulfide isomerase